MNYHKPVEKKSFIRSNLYENNYNSYVPKTRKWPDYVGELDFNDLTSTL